MISELANQVEAERRPRLRWDMVEIYLECAVSDALNHLGKEAEKSVIRDTLVVERWQHQYAAAAIIDCVFIEPDCLVNGAGARAWHQLGRSHAGLY